MNRQNKPRAISVLVLIPCWVGLHGSGVSEDHDITYSRKKPIKPIAESSLESVRVDLRKLYWDIDFSPLHSREEDPEKGIH